jgi:putative phage-type endonuclease
MNQNIYKINKKRTDMLSKKSVKNSLELLIFMFIKELGYDDKNLYISSDLQEIKETVYMALSSMYKSTTLKLDFDVEFDKIIKATQIVKPPEYDQLDVQNLIQQIEILKQIPSHAQRSAEWYAFRRENITASNIDDITADKTLGYYNAIKGKCESAVAFSSSTAPALVHGVKYEAVAAAVYEKRHNVNLLDFGCLPHKYIPHLAASPDGICDYSPLNKNYTGRMIEIKCPYSRQITGIIPDGYYSQIQVQLEVCDLMYCDYFECQIKPFDSFEEMDEYRQTIVNPTFRNDEYGVLIEYTMPKDTKKILYAYSPVGLSQSELDNWINHKIDELNDIDNNFILDRYSYWILEFSSCVLVKRDRTFFENIKPKILSFWSDVEYFRDNMTELYNIISANRTKSDYEIVDIISNVDIKTLCNSSDSDDNIPKPESTKKNKLKSDPIETNYNKPNKCSIIDSSSDDENKPVGMSSKKYNKVTTVHVKQVINTHETYKKNKDISNKKDVINRNKSTMQGICLLD